MPAPPPSRPRVIRSLEDLRVRIDEVRSVLGTSVYPAWHRGCTSAAFPLLPSLLRHPAGPAAGQKHEHNLLATFRTEVAKAVPAWSGTSWRQLCRDAAPRGAHAAARLVQRWPVALHFALRGPVIEGQPAIWVLNPFRLNLASLDKAVVFDETDRIPYDYLEELREHGRIPHRLPIATMPAWHNPRVAAQQGCFTVHGSDTAPLADQSRALEKAGRDPFVRKIPIPTELIAELQKHLRDIGVGEFALFPDLDGLTRDMRLRFAFDSRKPKWVRPSRKRPPDRD